MGRSLVKAALSHGDLVTAVGRTFQDTIPNMQDLLPASSLPPLFQQQQDKPNQPSPASATVTPTASDSRSRYLPLLCDVRIRATVDTVFQTSLTHWKRIDVIVNASGYGVIGACEDQDDFEIRNQFETNFWGTLHILQLSLPYFRSKCNAATADAGQMESGEGAKGGGRYLIFSSTGGSLGVPGLGPFCATKYAVEGLIESMLYETAAFDIRATLIEPGHVRRDDPTPNPATTTTTTSQQQQGKSKGKKPPAPTRPVMTAAGANSLPTFGHFFIKPASAAYDRPTAPAGHAKRMLAWLGDRQPTSAVKAVELVWQLGHCRFPPLRLLLGGFAVESVRDRLRGVTEEIEDWKFLSFRNNEQEEEGDKYQAGDQDGVGKEEDEDDEDDEDDDDDDDGDEDDGNEDEEDVDDAMEEVDGDELQGEEDWQQQQQHHNEQGTNRNPAIENERDMDITMQEQKTLKREIDQEQEGKEEGGRGRRNGAAVKME